MRSLFADLAVMQHDDAIGVLNRREPVGDDERSPIAHHALNRFLNELFGLRVYRAGCFVEDEDGRIERQARARN